MKKKTEFIEPNKINVLLDKADKLLEKSEYAQAEKLASEALSSGLERKDDEARAHCILCECYRRTGRYDDAFTNSKSALIAAEAASNLSLQSRALSGLASIQEWKRSDLNSARRNVERALALAENAEDKKQQAQALTIIGYVHNDLGDYSVAMDYYTRALTLSEEIDDKSAIAKNLGNIGGIFLQFADYAHSLEYFNRSLALAEELGDKQRVRRQLGSIGDVYQDLADYPQALNFYTRALALGEELGDEAGVERHLSDIGDILDTFSDHSSALSYYARALALAEKRADKSTITRHLSNFGCTYSNLNDYPRALDYFSRALALEEELGDKKGILINLGNIGNTFLELADYPRALEYLKRALKLSEEIGDRKSSGYWMHNLAKVEQKLGNLDAAYQGFLDTLHHWRYVLKTNQIVSDTLLELGHVLIEQGKTEEGLIRFNEALTLADELGEKKNTTRAHKEIADAYSKMGDMAKAYEHITKHLALDKEIFSEESRKKIETFNMRVAIANQERDTELARLRIKESEHETEVQQLRAEQSEKELSNTTLQLLSQTELLTDLRNGLLTFIRKFPLPDGAAKELRERLKTLPCKSIDWEKFDTQFKAAHPEFMKKLLEEYPKLSGMESRICSLIRMNLKSEEIARLFCLSARTVENHRQHIREKMKLKHEVDLALHLAKI